MGTKALPGTAVCAGGNERDPEHPDMHQPHHVPSGGYPPLQLPVPYRMYLPGTEAAGRCILLSFLVKAYAETELLLEKECPLTPGMHRG